jgi:hypothetical protein
MRAVQVIPVLKEAPQGCRLPTILTPSAKSFGHSHGVFCIMLKYRIFSFIFLILAIGFALIFLREKSNHNTLKIEADGCQAHKDLLHARAKKAAQEVIVLNKICKKTPEEIAKMTELALAPKPKDGKPAPVAVVETVPATPAPTPTPKPIQVSPVILDAKLSAVEKILQLSEAQKTSLREYFTSQIRGEAPTQKFDDIIGVENADFYRQQVSKSFEKAKTEEIEKEAFYLGAKLALTNDQVRDVISVMQQVNQEMHSAEATKAVAPGAEDTTVETDSNQANKEAPAPAITKDPREAQLEMLQAQIEREKAFQKAFDEQMALVLTEDQLRRYQQLKSERSSADAELWH